MQIHIVATDANDLATASFVENGMYRPSHFFLEDELHTAKEWCETLNLTENDDEYKVFTFDITLSASPLSESENHLR